MHCPQAQSSSANGPVSASMLRNKRWRSCSSCRRLRSKSDQDGVVPERPAAMGRAANTPDLKKREDSVSPTASAIMLTGPRAASHAATPRAAGSCTTEWQRAASVHHAKRTPDCHNA